MSTVGRRAAGHARAFTDRVLRTWWQTPGAEPVPLEGYLPTLLRGFRNDPPGTWPDWCWVPAAGTASVLADLAGDPDGGPPDGTWVGRLHAAVTWRVDRAVVVPDAADVHARAATGLPWQDVPVPSLEVLGRLPWWAVYVPVDGTGLLGGPGCRGFVVHLDHDVETGDAGLRCVLDLDGTPEASLPLTVPVDPDRPTLGKALDDAGADAGAGPGGPACGPLGLRLPGAGDDDVLADVVARVLLPAVEQLCDPDRAVGRADGVPGAPVRATADDDGRWWYRPKNATTVWDSRPCGVPVA